MSRDGAFFTVKVFPDGEEGYRVLDLSNEVTQLVFEDEATKADKLTLTVNNFDLKAFDDPIWKKGNMLEVTWGYPGDFVSAQRVIIQKVTGFLTLTVTAYAKSIELDKKVKSRVFENMTRSAVVKQIASREYDYSEEQVDVEDTQVVYPHITQARLTDAQFITRLAKREGYEFYVDSTGLHFHRPKMDQAPVREMVWYTDQLAGDFLSIDIEDDVMSKPGKVTKKGRDPIAKKAINEAVDDKKAKETALAPVRHMFSNQTGQYTKQFAASREETSPTSEAQAKGAEREAAGKLRKAQQAAVIINATIVGDPKVLAKKIVQISGISKRLSGKYYVKKAVHTVSASGYQVKFEAKRDGSNGYGKDDVKTAGKVNDQKPEEAAKLRSVTLLSKQTGQYTKVWKK